MTNLKYRKSTTTTTMQGSLWTLVLLVGFIFNTVSTQETSVTEFIPRVTATCKGETMNVKVVFDAPYSGAVHAREFRTKDCMVLGNGSSTVSLSLNMRATKGQTEYCGIHASNVSGDRTERSIQLAVRVHKTLELADDKFYVITCGKTGSARDDNAHVALRFLDNGKRVRETVYNREYAIRAELTHPNGSSGLKIKNCFAFDKKNTNITLIDERGCSLNPHVMSRFIQSEDGTSATAVIKSMFKFPEGSEVHLQCDVVTCTTKCPDEDLCSNVALASFSKGGSRSGVDYNEPSMPAATTVFVINPEEAPLSSPICEETGVRPAWLLWLTIALGVMFLIMLLMNIFLCTAMSCSCARTEIIEKEPSIIEEYDPYRSWHGSQYGSRYSLHGRDGQNKGYTSGGSTIHSNRSLPIDSDHYAIVHSRPGSRHSGVHGHRSRGPPSNL